MHSLPSSLLIRGTHIGDTTSGSLCDTTSSSKQFSRVPRSVYEDLRLKPLDLRIFCVMVARVGSRSVTDVGRRLICKAIKVSPNTVKRAQARLVEFGHMRSVLSVQGKRSHYQLLSEVFGFVSEAFADVVKPVGIAAVNSARERIRCPKCTKQVFQLLKTGCCRTCNHQAKLVRVIDNRIDRRIGKEMIA